MEEEISKLELNRARHPRSMDWRYQPSNLLVHKGDAVAIVYYSNSTKTWRLHDGIYLGGPYELYDDGKRPKTGSKLTPYMVGHYRLVPGTNRMCHEVIRVYTPHRIIRTSHSPYPQDNPLVKPYHPACTHGTITAGRAVAVQFPGDVKNGLLLYNTCRFFSKQNGRVALNHFVLVGGEEMWKNPKYPPSNKYIKGVSHVFSNVSFVKVATKKTTSDCP